MKTTLALMALVATAGTAHAASITETTDFQSQVTSGFLTPVTPAYDFSQVGGYSVSGSLAVDCDQGGRSCPNDYSDVFSFTMGPNREIRNLMLVITNASAAFDDVFSTAFGGSFKLSVAQLGFGTIDFDGDGTFAGPIVTSIPEGEIHTLGINIANGTQLSTKISADWSISFDVAEIVPVPLPAGGLLLIAGLAGLVAAGRRGAPRT